MSKRAAPDSWIAVACLLFAASSALGQVPSYRLVTWSPSDSFSELRLDHFGNSFYVRTTAGVRVLEQEEWELARVGAAAPWDPTLTVTWLAPDAAAFGRVFAQANVSGPGITAANDQVSFVASNLAATLVTQEGTTPAPGTEAGVKFSGPSFGSMRIWSGEKIAMMSGLTGPGIVATIGDPARNSDGVWRGPPAALELVARTSDPAPGYGPGDVLHEILSGDGGGEHMAPVRAGGTVVFLAQILLDGGGSERAIYSQHTLGALFRVVADGDPLPGGGSLNTLKTPTLSRSGRLVFSDASGIYSTEPGSLHAIAKLFGPAPGGGLFSVLGLPAVARHALVFRGETTTPPFRRIFLETDTAALSVLVQQDDPAPDTAGTFERFRTHPVVNACGEVAFYGELNLGGSVTTANDEGIWAYDASGSGVLIAREGDAADPLGFPGRTISAVHLLDDGSTNLHSGPDEGGVAVFNDRSELLFSIDLSDGSEAVMIADVGTQCDILFESGLEEGDFSGWSSSVP